MLWVRIWTHEVTVLLYSFPQQYLEAEFAFEEVLRLDAGCLEAKEEIKRVRVTKIVEMGFTTRQADNAITKYTHVQVRW